jgi:MFS family permease
MPSRSDLYTPVFWLACGVHFTGAMSLAMLYLVPLFVERLGGDELTIGLLVGVGMAASVGARPGVGWLLDRLGPRAVLVAGGVLNAATIPPFVGVESVGGGLWAVNLLHLVAGGVLFAAYFAYVADIVPAARRAEGLAVFGSAGILPNGFGPALGEWLIAEWGFTPFFLVATGFGVLSLLLTLGLPAARHATAAHGAPAPNGATTLFGGGLAPILGMTLVFGAGVEVVFYFVAPYATAAGIGPVGPVFVAYATATMGVRVLGRRVLDTLGPQRTAAPAFVCFAIGLTLLALRPSWPLLVVAGIACGLGHGALFPVLGALAIARTPPRLRGTTMSLYTGAVEGGGVVGTPIAGALARTFGYSAMFGLMAAVSLGGAALVRFDGRRGRPRR